MRHTSLILVLFAGLGTPFSIAQDGPGIVDCIMQRKLVVPYARGRVFDPFGVPVPGAQISLSRDGLQQAQSRTDADGRFEVSVPPGGYHFKAEMRGFEVTKAELEVGRDIANTLHPKALRVILALGSMNCPWVTTSRKEFKEMVHKRTALHR